MALFNNIELDFEIDKLTNSIENAASGEVFDTLITRLNTADSRQIKKTAWAFNWQAELNNAARQVYKLTPINNPSILRGLISMTDKKITFLWT